ncbi:glutamate racemase [Bacteroidota bacterium]
MENKNQPIGIFDSGVGGLSVWKDLVKVLPNESVIYYADNANCPYGPKKEETIINLVSQVVDFLISKNCKIIIVACNTATAAAIDFLRTKYTLPFINLLGLSIALASAFLILLFVIHEVSFDKFHKNRDRIYRLNTSFKWGDDEVKMASSSLLTKPYLINEFPEIEYVTRVFDGKYWGDGQFVKKDNEFISEEQFKFVMQIIICLFRR